MFNGQALSNNSYIDADEESDVRIFCITNNTDCCSNTRDNGNWYSPSGELIVSSAPPPTVRRRSQMLELSTGDLDLVERGRFSCKIKNANYIEESIHFYLCECTIN